MRGVLCDSKYKEQLQSYAASGKLTIGLIIGQIIKDGKDLVVHLAETHYSDKSEEKEEEPNELSDLSSIKNSIVAEHALNAIRMIVGGFDILGLFVVSKNNLMNNDTALMKIKTLLMDIKSTLVSNGKLYADTEEFDGGNKIFLNFVGDHKNFICKTITIDPTKALNSAPVDWKFVSSSVEFYEFETKYEVATAFPMPHTCNHFESEKYIMGTIDNIASNLAKSIMLFNREPCEPEMTVDKFMKNFANDESPKVDVTIYSDAVHLATSENGILSPHQSVVKYTGIVASRVYGAPRNTMAHIKEFIHHDIIRSMTTRLHIYYDALLANDDGGNDDENEKDCEVNSTCPPRRVFFPLENSSITFCDYLFPNENQETTVKQSMDILGIHLEKDDVDCNAEAAIETIVNDRADIKGSVGGDGSCNEAANLAQADGGKLIIILGIVGIIVALVVSVILHFLMK